MVSAHPTIYSFLEVELIDCYQTVSIANASVWQKEENGVWSVIKKSYCSAPGITSDPGAYFNYRYEQLLSVVIFPGLKDRRGYHVMLCL